MNKRHFTSEQIEFLNEYIPGHWWAETYKEYQKRFPGSNITLGQLSCWCYRNLTVRNGMDGEIKRGMHFSPGTEFKKGQKPSRPIPKGARLSPATEFKKGNKPFNTMPIGSEMMKSDGYIWVKVNENGLPGRPWRKWEQKHRLLWQAHHGPIPQGSKLIFINGDTSDIRLENLMLITNRQHVYLNHTGLRGGDSKSIVTALNLHQLTSSIYSLEEQRRKEKSTSEK